MKKNKQNLSHNGSFPISAIITLIMALVTTSNVPPPHYVYIPLVITPLQYKGLALADPLHPGDIDALGASWWYDWTPTGGVPMLWSGRPSTDIPQHYAGYILVLNEPNLSSQANVTPYEAVKRLAILRAYYPDARLLCCGVSIWAGDWMREFWQLGGRPDAWHVHAYTESYITPDYVKRDLTAWHNLTGGDYWVTEYGSPAGSLVDFRAVTEWFMAQQWIKRIAAYTNRQPDGVPWAIGEGVEMVNPDGALSPIGEWYSAYPGPAR
jgi:hypothetical protein